PTSALIRHEGEVFVFLERADALFSRTAVELEKPVEQGWVAKGELKPGDKIVITGGQQLLSEELKAQRGGEGFARPYYPCFASAKGSGPCSRGPPSRVRNLRNQKREA